MTKKILILSVFVVASCGLAYELIAGALSSYLLGDSVLQFSTIIGCYLFAMGVGAHLSKYVKDEHVLARFVDIELAIGLIGGVSAALLFTTFSWMAAPFRLLLYVLVFMVGTLVGMEVPLVMRALNARQTEFAEIVSRVLTFDYLGALAVSLLFPLVLAPYLGLVRTGYLFGMLNIGVALWTIYVFRAELTNLTGRTLRACGVLLALAFGFASADRLTHFGEHALFGDEIVYATSTPYQRLVITRWKDDLRLYINGNLQFSSRDEYRYHEALVHPALERLPWAKRVLVLGGGDGLALREILRYKNVEHVTLVDLDPAMTAAFKTRAELAALNHGSLSDPRVTVVNADAAIWLEHSDAMFDAVIVDFPDPSSFALGKLYSVPFYGMVKHHLAANGLVVVQSTSPFFAPHAFWTIDATLREVGLRTYPYHAYVPSFGEWGFILATPQGRYEPPASYRLPMRFLNGTVTAAMFSFPPDMRPLAMAPNRLDSQSLVHEFEQDWHRTIR
ncbi:spermidine synthase [Pseudoduganella flava]|uniref:Polyamine aminopropyltransferase n=1 Tax=Pseudoduganella flava TaxID=871742 RepID=A0A562PNW9_9BURK|nr:polyamine aminopropyltransferase [Pseudoduganella flava]QGZ40450.1 polyamine aminopropyltransferase [Pseudoduganella flava]TWI45890.1 spermidine synthase [Pseudoduganella flava]